MSSQSNKDYATIEGQDSMEEPSTDKLLGGRRVSQHMGLDCDGQPVEKDGAIKDGKESMEELSAAVTDTSAGIESATAKIEDVSTKISDTEGELSTAIALRNKENEEFVKQEEALAG